MTTTETTKRPSTNTITRRKMLRSVAVTSALAIAASINPSHSAAAVRNPEQASPELLDLIRAHRAAWESLGDSVNAADSMHPDYAGSEGEAIWEMRNDAEQEALQLVLAFPVLSLTDAQVKATYLASDTFGLDEYDLDTLLASIADADQSAPDRRPVPPVDVAPYCQPVQTLIAELIDAISAETSAFLTAPDDEGEVITDAAIDRVMAAEYALLSAPKRDLLNDNRTASEVAQALALLQRRWLVMEGGYQNEHQQAECLMVDLLLQGTRFDDVPLLWHVSGKSCDRRPSDAELQAGWEG